ncbi:MAG: exonuclease domain-containing protein [Glaciecola sp.]|jgi:DNA polymerase-3 subunit epsilon|nr:exonuclease domain-containing protein [Glaciecola sp.]MDG1816553.1 exonuclease domain-containing protein [Glaciecola sp.]MDG2098819.1 exonuclease domain-containing protein [Glaciecola sp.]
MKDLPTYYYLEHFQECLGFIDEACTGLLGPEHSEFMHMFALADLSVQCTLVRSLNRKASCIKVESLAYDEIPDHEGGVEQCFAYTWFTSIPEHSLNDWLVGLTKPELVTLLRDCSSANVVASANKASMVELALAHLSFTSVRKHSIYERYIYRQVDGVLDYLLFLFFGNVGSRLNQFSMRDLGVMRTGKRAVQAKARFSSRDQALSTYVYALELRRIKSALKHNVLFAPRWLLLSDCPDAHGDLAEQHRDEYLWLWGKYCLQAGDDWTEVAKIFAASSLPQAQEKAIRLAYQHGNKQDVQGQLEAIIDAPDNSHILAFAEDFLARKYHKKRTSVLTDMLRNSARHLILDEVHKHRVEAAAVEYYQAQGIKALRTENELWRSVFGLVFWPILFAPEFAIGTEFDWRPYHVRHNNLYTSATAQVEQILKQCETRAGLKQHLIRQATIHYGQRSGIFRWHKQLLQRLLLFVDHVDVSALISVLRMMAQDYSAYSDGFPDLLVITDDGVHFEEIKAQGDSVRKNQLLTITMLTNAGIKVGITTVEWGIDPMQPYVVVDIETTGGRAAQHKITEIGMVKVVNGEIIEEYETLLNPQRRIPRNITALTGIDDAMVADAPIFAEVADEVAQFTKGCVFVAHNVNFDYGFIKQEFTRIERRFSRAKLCTVREMRKAKPGLKSYSLANLTAAFNIDMTRHHRAMSDAIAANELLTIINNYRLNNKSC